MKILFQGDSITDAGRSRDEGGHLGVGYPTLVAAQLNYEKPGQFVYLNRAVSGSRIVDLYAAWKKDAVNLQPDMISILIGINDVWHEARWQNGVEADRFERIYDMMLSYTKQQLPAVRLMILEPFVLPGTATQEQIDYYRDEVHKRSLAARRVAERQGAIFVPLQKTFDEKCSLAPASHWLRDGVHPTEAGHQIIAHSWIQAFEGSSKL